MPGDMHEFILKRSPLFWQPAPGGIGLFVIAVQTKRGDAINSIPSLGL